MIFLQLNNGDKMPAVGYGTWQAKDKELEEALEIALEAGYRHIDTAHYYGNEHVIGKVLQRWMSSGKVKREELYIVTKLPMHGNRPSGVEKFLKLSLEKLQLDYVDMYLIHMPLGIIEGEEFSPKLENGKVLFDMATDHVATWKAMEEQVDAGRTRSIGISNFNKKQIERVILNSRIKPSNLQIELHVYLQQKELVEYCRSQGIVVTSYSTLGSWESSKQFGNPRILDDPVVGKIAQKYGKSPGQILLRHMIQQNIAVIPKSITPKRVKENFELFNFELSKEDMSILGQLDKGKDGRLFYVHYFLPGIENHPEYPY